MIRISHSIAQEIAAKVSSLIGYNINIFSRNGSIIGTTETERIDKFHQGAYEAIKKGKDIIITEKNIHKYQGAKPGINLPLTLNDTIIGAVGITGNPEMIKIHGMLTKVTVETMLKASLMERQTKLENRALENFLYNLLYDDYSTETKPSLKERASLLGIDLDTPRIALAINITAEVSNFSLNKEKILSCINFVLKGNNQYLAAYTGGNNFVVFIPVININDLTNTKKTLFRISKSIIKLIKNQHGLDALIGIGSLINKSYYSLKDNFQEACEALSAGKKFKKESNIYFIDELGLGLLLNNIPVNITDSFIKYLVGYKEKVFNSVLDNALLYTLKIFFDCNLNISETARALYIHRNTLLYRLDKIYKITNRDPRVFSEAMELKILLLLSNSCIDEDASGKNTAIMQ